MIIYAGSIGQNGEKAEGSRDSSLWVNSFSWTTKVPVPSPFMRRMNRLSRFGVLFLSSVVTAKNPGFLTFGPLDVLGRYDLIWILWILYYMGQTYCVFRPLKIKGASSLELRLWGMIYMMQVRSIQHYTFIQKKNPNHVQRFLFETLLQMKAYSHRIKKLKPFLFMLNWKWISTCILNFIGRM